MANGRKILLVEGTDDEHIPKHIPDGTILDPPAETLLPRLAKCSKSDERTHSPKRKDNGQNPDFTQSQTPALAVHP